MKKIFPLIITFLTIISCQSDDSSDNSIFYSEDQFVGSWYAYKAEGFGNTVDINANYPNCGYDFFVFTEEGRYTDYVFNSSDCTFISSSGTWSLDGNQIKIKEDKGEELRLTVNNITNQAFDYTIHVDADGDGGIDAIKTFANKYTDAPSLNLDHQLNNFGVYTNDYTGESDEDAIYLYYPNSVSDFDRYEIYQTKTCDYSESELIDVLYDVELTNYIDISPKYVSEVEKLCYFVKVYSKGGLEGVSEIKDLEIEDSYIEPSRVTIDKLEAVGNKINIDWSEYEGLYFKSYRIYKSTNGASIGGDWILVDEIEDRETSFYIDEEPLYSPISYYRIEVVNIFNRTAGIMSSIEYSRDDLFNISSPLAISYEVIDKNSSFMYGYYRDNVDHQTYIYKLDYIHKQIVSKYKYSLSPSFISLSSNGNELYVGSNGGEVDVISTRDMTKIKNLENLPKINSSIKSLEDIEINDNFIIILSDNLWDISYINVYDLDMQLLDKKEINNTDSYDFTIENLKDNSFLLAPNYNADEIIQFSVDTLGKVTIIYQTNNEMLKNKEKEFYKDYIVVGSTGKLFFNTEELNSFGELETSKEFIRPKFTITDDGSYIVACEDYENKLYVYSYPSLQKIKEIETKGDIKMLSNNNDKIIIRSSLSNNTSFIETFDLN